MHKTTLSIVLATFNEEKNLPGCLESIKDIADEIIIVDGQSTDNTVAVARSFGAKVQSTENHPMFHINKQKAIDLATKQWVLQLDADERVTKELGEEIERKINDKDSNFSGFWIPRKNWFLGRYLMKGGAYPDYTLRLYKNGKGRLPQKDVHEQAVVEGSVGYIVHPLEHLADPYFGRYLFRFNRYTNLMSQELKEKKLGKNVMQGVRYIFVLPLWSFIMVYVRHKGFLDGWQGFVWAFFSAMRFPVSYMKYQRGTS